LTGLFLEPPFFCLLAMGARRGAREAPTPLQSKIGRGRRRDWKGAELRFDRKKIKIGRGLPFMSAGET
jgi:hypothetical protein